MFGDHQDYLGLPIIACAINKHITLTAKKNNTNFLCINLPDIHKKRKISIFNEKEKLEKDDFFQAAINVLERYNCNINSGYDIHITGTIPINSGTSSSSALIVAWVQFLIKAFGPQELLTSENIAQIAFESEVLEFNNPGGKMDQYSIALGNIIYLETGANFSFEVLKKPLEGLIMADSGVPKETNNLLNKLKENSWEAIHLVKKHLPKFTIETAEFDSLESYVNFLPNNLKPYLEAALGNYTITKKALLEFKKPDLDLVKIGELMNQHHHYLKNKLNITVPKIDLMIDTALKNGAYGAKIVGSGGGGSIAILAPKHKEEISKALITVGAKNVYLAKVDKGARIIE